MKYIFWILLLGNVILFAFMQSGGLFRGEQGGQAQTELNGELIHLMPALQSVPTKSVPAPIPVAPAPAPAPAQASVVPVSAPVAVSTLPSNEALLQKMDAATVAKQDTLICLEWGDFSGADLMRANAALSALHLADKLSQRKIERDMGFWVYFPPLKNKVAVKQKIAELKELGINEYYVVQTPGRLLNAISLGVFKTQEAAQNFLERVRAKGVRTAKIGEHASKLRATVFFLNKVDAATELKLTEMQKNFLGTELKKVSCAH